MAQKWIDMHVHTRYCGHASLSAVAAAEAAVAQRLSSIGFTGHFPYPPDHQADLDNCVIPSVDFEAYWRDISEVQDAWASKLTVRRGVEIDYLPAHTDWARKALSRLDLDVVLGSVHSLDGVTIDYDDAHLAPHFEALGGVNGLWERYWAAIVGLIESGLCDVLAHLDLPRKLVTLAPQRDYRERLEGIIDAMLRHNLVMEINTGGIDRACDRSVYPAEWIIRRAVARGIPLTLGSDAHHPDEIARHFDIVIPWLRALGVTQVMDFSQRQALPVVL